MTEIQQFLSRHKLQRCDRLNANITPAACEANRKRQDDHKNDIMAVGNCKGCPGLQEENDMAQKIYRGTCHTCKRDDVRLTSKNGQCHSCYKRDLATRTGNDIPVISAAVAKRGAVTEKRSTAAADPVPGVTVAEQSTSIELEYLRSLLDAALLRWESELDQAPTPRDKARRYLDMCEAAEGLGC